MLPSGQSSDRFSLVMRELWDSITTEERAEICSPTDLTVTFIIKQALNIT